MEYFPENDHQKEVLEAEIHLRDYWQVIMKYRWTIFTIFTIIFITVAISTFKMTPLYQATAQIQIDSQNPNVLSIEEVVSLNARDKAYYQTQYKILQSRSLAKAVIDTLNLADSRYFLNDGNEEKGFLVTARNSLLTLVTRSFRNFFKIFTPSSQQLLAQSESLTEEEMEKMREARLTTYFLKNLQIEPVRNSELVNIRFSSKSPRMAAKVANTLIQQYIQRNIHLKYKAAMEASTWLDQHVGELKKKLESSEESLHTYIAGNKIISLEEKQNIIIQNLSELSSAINKARTERIGLENLYHQIQELNGHKEAMESLPSVMNNSLIQQLKNHYISLQSEYDYESQRYGPKHPRIIKIGSQLKTLKKRIDAEIQKIIDGIKTEYELALEKENELSEALEEEKRKALELNKKAIKYSVLKRDTESNKQMFEVVLNRLKETDLTRGLKTSNISVVDWAEIPKKPIKPKKALNLTLAALVGLFLGLGFAFFLEYLDNTIKTPKDLKQYLNLPFLGPVPHFDLTEQRGVSTPELITLHHPKSQINEAYKGLRTNIMFSFPDSSPKTLLITSASPSEGKTITSVNLAITMAQSGAKVIIVDCDMRKPCLHRTLKVANDKGISSLLIGQCTLDDIVKQGPIPNLEVIPCGQRPPNPSELLVSANFKKILNELKSRYDLVLIDSPPIVPVTDSVIISRLVDGTALVVHGGVTSRDVIRGGCDLLQKAEAHILGAVINNINLAKRNYYYYYQYYYHQYYGDDENIHP